VIVISTENRKFIDFTGGFKACFCRCSIID
jgi:hypothetical protein